METYQKSHAAEEGHLVNYIVSKYCSHIPLILTLTEVDTEERTEDTARREASIREFDLH
jgi:hypothetical protein